MLYHMMHCAVWHSTQHFEDNFLCNFLNKSEPSYQLEMVYSFYNK